MPRAARAARRRALAAAAASVAACLLTCPRPADGFACARPGATCAALGDLYAATGGPEWEIPGAAGVGVPPTAWPAAAAGAATEACTLEGVTCDAGGNVVALQLRDSVLVGAIPASLGNISSLASLDLGSNFLSGTVPASLGRLGALTALLLDDNLLSGALPAPLAALRTLSVDRNRLDGGTVAGALCAAPGVCGASAAFGAASCPLAGCAAAACVPSAASCRSACAVPAGAPGANVSAVAAFCVDSLVAASCNECTLALVASALGSGVALPDAATLGTCIADPVPEFLAAGASPATLSGALHDCSFMRRVLSPNASACPVTLPPAAFAPAVAACAVPTSACNTCSATLINIFIRAGLAVPPLGLTFTTAHFEVVSDCLAHNVLSIVRGNVSAETLLRGFAYCTGPSPGWYAAVANATRPPPPAAIGSAGAGAGGNAAPMGIGAAVGASLGGVAAVVAAAAVLLRRSARVNSSRQLKDSSALTSVSMDSGTGGPSGSVASFGSSAAPPPLKPLLLGEELVLGDMIGLGGYARVHRAAWNGTQVAVKCFGPLAPALFAPLLGLNKWESGPDVGTPPAPRSSGGSGAPLLGLSGYLGGRFSNGGGGAPGLAPDTVNGLMQELQLLQSLRHPNICAVYALVLRPPMLVIELAPAGSLAALLRRCTSATLSWQARMSIGAGTAAGVEFLHAQSPPVIHRDLKSANVVLSDSLVPKLCDFGLSRVLPVLAASTSRAGTAKFMAPEVARGLEIRRPTAIDVYGVGIVLHDLAHLGITEDDAPLPPLSQTTTDATAVAVLYKRASTDFAMKVESHVPPPLRALLDGCLAVDPIERPESAAVRAQLLVLSLLAPQWSWS